MSKHTPGPWIGAGPSFGLKFPKYTTEIVTEWEDGEGNVVSICELPFSEHDDENEANARLIAAAPELLKALRIAREHILIDRDSFQEAHRYPDGSMEREDQKALDRLDAKLAKINAAIAKAEGQ